MGPYNQRLPRRMNSADYGGSSHRSSQDSHRRKFSVAYTGPPVGEDEDEEPIPSDIEEPDPDEYRRGSERDSRKSHKSKSKCTLCLSGLCKLITFILSRAGLISLVILYCLLGAITFESLERNYEIAVKKNMTKVRSAVSDFLWEMTDRSQLIVPDEWVQNASLRLQTFEWEIIRLMRKEGWDGVDSLDQRQWTFAGALFYSIVVITTIGYGHITPKTAYGKIVTIFYAVLGIPLMLICLSHIGDFLATAFRILYWKVCCFICTRRQRALRRARNLRNLTRMGTPKRSLRRAKSYRAPGYRSKESPISDSIVTDSLTQKRSHFRRTFSHDDFRNLDVPNLSRDRERLPSRSPSSSFRRTAQQQQQSTFDEEPATMSLQNEIQLQNQEFGSSLQRTQLNLLNNTDKLPIYVNKYAKDDITPISSFRGRDKFQRRPNPYYYGGPSHHRLEQFVLEEDFEYFYDDDDYYMDDSDEEQEVRKRPVPIWLCILLVLSYIVGGAFLFANWEGWRLLDSAYFCFVTLTTIGFGDYVPAQKVKRDVEVSIALCSVYLLFGISLLAMSFNLVQEQLFRSIRNVALKLGIISEEEET